MEALGLGIFMVSACFFAGQLWHEGALLNKWIIDNNVRNAVMGIAMALTALFIFYAPFTAPSGSHINPAVTLVQLRLGNISNWDSVYYITFQFVGGTAAVYLMKYLMGDVLTASPVNYVVTVPGSGVNWLTACLYECAIGFIMITMVLFTSTHSKLNRYTRVFAACLVCAYVIIAGPVSGFGMNPARSFASAFPAGNFTYFWVYLICPILSMLAAAELFLWVKSKGSID
jgi:aquaporin Z